MIPYNFEYYRPATIKEAIQLFLQLTREGKEPLYFSGGTEIITFGRINRVYTRAIIDIKSIPECNTLELYNQKLILGSALTLSHLNDSMAFPLLGEVAAGVADRTSRNKITLGGNICSRLIYREAVLPFLLTDSEVRIAGPAGFRQVPIQQVFKGSLQLQQGEFLLQTITDTSYIKMPFAAVKRRKVADIDYPLVTIAAIRTDSMVRIAFSGVCAFPFRSQAVEDILNRQEMPLDSKIDESIAYLPAPILDDIKGSAAYRRWVLKMALHDTMQSLGGV